MKSWKAMLEVVGALHDDGVTLHPEVEFKVPEKLYNKISSAIKQGKELSTLDFYKELVKRTDDALDLESFLIDEGFLYSEEPAREDCDSEEDYQEALEEFENEKAEAVKFLSVENIYIYDPTEEKHFKEKYIGKTLPKEERGEDGAGCKRYNFTWEDYEYGERSYSLKIHYDKDGIITDITDISGMAEETNCFPRGGRWGEIYPDYDFIAERLDDMFEEYEEEEDDD